MPNQTPHLHPQSRTPSIAYSNSASPILAPQQGGIPHSSYPSSISTGHRQSIASVASDVQNHMMDQYLQEGGFINPQVEMATALNTAKNAGYSPLSQAAALMGGHVPGFHLDSGAGYGTDDSDAYTQNSMLPPSAEQYVGGGASPRHGSRRGSLANSPLHRPVDNESEYSSYPASRRESVRSLNVPGAAMGYDQSGLLGTSPGSERFGTHQSRRGSVASTLGISNARPISLGPLSAAEIARDVKALRTTLKEKRVDEKVIIEILGFSTPDQAVQLAQAYKANFGVTLAEALDKELSGNFRRMCVALATSLADNDAIDLHEAMSGFGVNEELLIEILVGRSNAEVRAIMAAYKNLYGKDLESAITKELSSDLKRLFIVLLQAQRDETAQLLDVEEDVESLFQAGKSKSHKDVYVFISILCNRSNTHLLQVFETYHRKHGMTVEELIRKDFKGDLEKTLMALVHSIQNRPAHVAELFETALHASGHVFNKVDEAKLIRLTVRHRNPRVMALVREAYQAVFGQSLYRRVEETTSGEFRRLMLTCIGLDGV
ncbi:hypothetical protein HDV00_001294 [Rhizophlyctis rosea]|nr:hypothetical protein HDV00_001294 [Rhizophlyctis rosea]